MRVWARVWALDQGPANGRFGGGMFRRGTNGHENEVDAVRRPCQTQGTQQQRCCRRVVELAMLNERKVRLVAGKERIAQIEK
jgi:hypothetical protein